LKSLSGNLADFGPQEGTQFGRGRRCLLADAAASKISVSDLVE